MMLFDTICIMKEVVLGCGISGARWASNRPNTFAIDKKIVKSTSQFAVGLGTALPFRQQQFEVVYMDFLLNDSANSTPFHSHILNGGSHNGPDISSLLRAEKLVSLYGVLQEAVRVMRGDGHISIVDTAYNITLIRVLAENMKLLVSDEPVTADDFARSESLGFVLSHNEAVNKISLSFP